MKTTWKNFTAALLMLVSFIALAFAPVARAQNYIVNTLTLPNAVPTNGTALTFSAGTTNLITATKHDAIGLHIGFESNAANASNVVFAFAYTLDGTTNIATTGGSAFNITLTANGTTRVHHTTNIYMGTIGYLSLTGILQNGSQPITNVVVRYSLKPKRNG